MNNFHPIIKGGYRPKKEEPKVPDFGRSLDSIINTVVDLENVKKRFIAESDAKMSEVDKTITSVEERADEAIGAVKDIHKQAIEHIKNVKQGEPGKDANAIDEDKIVENVLARIPEPKKIDLKAITKSVLKAIPENKASLKIIQEKIEMDPMSVIDKIMAMPEGKFKLKQTMIDGLEQTMSAFRSQLGRGYLHGGGDTVKAGTGITLTKNTDGTTTIVATGGGTNYWDRTGTQLYPHNSGDSLLIGGGTATDQTLITIKDDSAVGSEPYLKYTQNLIGAGLRGITFIEPEALSMAFGITSNGGYTTLFAGTSDKNQATDIVLYAGDMDNIADSNFWQIQKLGSLDGNILNFQYVSIPTSVIPLTLTPQGNATFRQTQDSSSGNVFSFDNDSTNGLTSSDSIQNFFSLTPDVSQTGTAGYNGILLDVNQISLGSGVSNLLNLKVGGGSRFRVTRFGDMVMESTGGYSPYIYQYGDISGSAKYVSSRIDTGYYQISREDANVLGMKVNMPFDTGANLITGGNVTSGTDPGHSHSASSITEADPLSWSKASAQSGLTGDKTGSFDIDTTGTGKFNFGSEITDGSTHHIYFDKYTMTNTVNTGAVYDFITTGTDLLGTNNLFLYRTEADQTPVLIMGNIDSNNLFVQEYDPLINSVVFTQVDVTFSLLPVDFLFHGDMSIDRSITANGHYEHSSVRIATPVSIDPLDDYIICNGGTMTVNLEAATGSGRVLKFKNTNNSGTATITADTSGTPDTIDGQASIPLYYGEFITLVDYASNKWMSNKTIFYGDRPQLVKKVASANIRNSHDAVSTSTSATYIIKKTITLTDGPVGQQRFLFDIKTSNILTTAYGRIYRNSVALGTEQSTISLAYITKSEDITQTWNPGDTVELWVHINGSDTVSVQNFRIAYDDSPTITVASVNS
jgi:hypothetical protein